MPITIYVYIIGDSEIDIWGLSGRERLRRMVASRAQAKLVDKIAQIPGQAAVLLLRADYLFDDRVLATLISAKTYLTLVTNEGQPAAMRVSIIDATSALGYLKNGQKRRTTPFRRAIPRRISMYWACSEISRKETSLTCCLSANATARSSSQSYSCDPTKV
jgi:hypothetical protein